MQVKINNNWYWIKDESKNRSGGSFKITAHFTSLTFFKNWFSSISESFLKSDICKDIESKSPLNEGIYRSCQIIEISFDSSKNKEIEYCEYFDVTLVYDYFEPIKKPKETNIELVPVVIPEGKKIIKTELESGLLLTFENKTNVDNHITDLEYMRNNILNAMGIPKKYWNTTSTYVPVIKLTPLEIIEKYFTIYDATQNKVVPFKLMSHQKKILESFESNNGTIVKQYRQAGVTVLEAAYTATQLILNNKTNIMLFYSRLENGTHFIKLVRDFIKQYSKEKYDELLDPFIINNTKGLTTRNGSSIKCFSSTNNFRGLGDEFFKTVTHVIIDNAAWVELSLVTQGILEYKLPNNIKVIISSTDTCDDNLFKINWDHGKFANTNLNKIKLEWFNDPRYNKDLEWIKVEQKINENGIFKIKTSISTFITLVYRNM